MKTLTRYRVNTTLLLIIAAAPTWSGALLAQETKTTVPVQPMTYRDHTVHVVITTPGYKLLGGSYETMDRSITSGQDPEGRNDPPQQYDVSGYDGSISFSAGKQASRQVGTWFNQRVGITENTFATDAYHLNFALGGTLSLYIQGPGIDPNRPVVFKNIYVANGPGLVPNDWWFGGPDCHNWSMFLEGEHTIRCRPTTYPATPTFDFKRGGNARDVIELTIG